MATPSTVDWVSPHEFHGISTEVTEVESSIERLNSLGSSPLRLYRLRYRLPFNIIDRYWSPVHPLSINPVAIVVVTVLRDELIRLVMECVMRDNIPEPIRTPPNIIALSIRYMVGNIPFIPPVDMRESSVGSPVVSDVSVTSSLTMAVATSVMSADEDKEANILGCHKNIPTIPSILLSPRVTAVFSLNTISPIVARGMSRHHGVMLNIS